MAFILMGCVNMTKRENILRAIRFENPEYIPMVCAINSACFETYHPDDLFDLMEEHTFLFPDFVRPKGEWVPSFAPIAQKGVPFIDDFGCVWETAQNGITGIVTRHPLADWEDFKKYKKPNPQVCMGIGEIDWAVTEKSIRDAKAKGHFTSGGLRHGHTFLQLIDLRGYENLIYDFMDDDKRIYALIDMVEEFNMYSVKKYVDMGVDMLSYAEDLGMQVGPMVSPDNFRKYIKPSYERLMKPARDNGCIVHMHSDGDITALVDDILDGGVDVINLQDLVNGVDWIADRFKGRVCVDLDIDRQLITALGTPKEVDELILHEVKTLGSKEGGLMMIFGLYPDVPLENVEAIMDAMERYAFYYQS